MTSLDTRDAAISKYTGAASNSEALGNDGAKVLHGIDASRLKPFTHPKSRWLFDIVSWNFPYPVVLPSSWKTTNAKDATTLMAAFFASVAGVLAPGGRVRLVLAKSQGGSTREIRAKLHNWNMEEVAEKAGFELIEVLPFTASFFPGYEPRREMNNETFPSSDARVHVFGRRQTAPAKAKPAGDAPAEPAERFRRRVQPDNVINLGGDVASSVEAEPPHRPRSSLRHLYSRFAELRRSIHDDAGLTPQVVRGIGGVA